MPKQVRINGVVYSVPENASMDQIQEYVGSKGVKAPAPAKSAVKAGSAEPVMYPGRGPTGIEEMQDRAADVLTGIPKAVTSFPSTVVSGLNAAWEMLKENPAPTLELVRSALQPVTTSLRGAGALIAPKSVKAPSIAEFKQAAQGAGANLGGIIAGEAVGSGLGKIAEKLPKTAEGLYQEGLKPGSRVNSNADIRARVQTGLQNAIPISESGLGKLRGLVDALNTSIESDIASNPKAPISPSNVAGRLKSARSSAKVQALPETDVAAIDAARAEFLRQHQTPGTPAVPPTPTGILDAYGKPIMNSGTAAVAPKDIPIPAESAQALKKGTYQSMNKKAFGEEKSGTVEAQKALARGLKEELENIFPEIKGKNAAEGKLIDLQPDLNAAVNRLGNKPTLSRILHLLSDPAITSRIAIVLKQAGVPASQIAQRISALGAIEGSMAKPPANRRDAMNALGHPVP